MWRNALSKFLLTSLSLPIPLFTTLAQQLVAPAWPLAVKNPFVNAWFRAGTGALPFNQAWPEVWNLLESTATDSNLGWFCGVLVDGQSYRLQGVGPGTASTQVSVQITPTQTSVLHQVGQLQVTMNFVSPITATDLTRQSLPFVYLTFTASSMDGAPHSLQVFSDISAEWIIGDNSISADTADEPAQNNFVILQALQQTAMPFVVINERAQDSSAILATANGNGVRYGVGSDVRNRGMNATTPALSNTVESGITSHNLDNPWDTWGFTVDLGNITDMTTPFVTAIGVIRDPSIQFAQLSGNVENRSSYYQTNFSTPLDIVSFFLNDFDNSMNMSTQLDTQIINDATNISQSYADLLSLVARQAMGAIEITLSKNSDGSFNSSDVMAFMRDMGDVGGGYINAVDVLYAAFPVYLYLNPDLGGHLLRPLLVAQDNSKYSQPYATRGLGQNFPNATAENVAHNFGVEESGNMIIMLLAHLQATGDGSLVKQHYSLIKGWADYLVQFSMNPGFQQTSPSDGISSVNQTNLALKGIIGLGAMAKISDFVGNGDDASLYNNAASSYIDSWKTLSISSDKTHLLTSFAPDSSESAGLIYNLYADKLLQLGLVPQSVYDLQTSYYHSQIPSSKFGIPLDSSNPTVARADWMMFAAAASGDDNLLSSMISLVHSYTFTPSTNVPLSPLYDPTTGNSVSGINSPSMGAVFAALALNKPLKLKVNGTVGANTPPPSGGSQTTTNGAKNEARPIIVGVICGVVAIGLLFLGVFFYKRRTQKRKRVSIRPYAETDDSARRLPNSSESSINRPDFYSDVPRRKTEAISPVSSGDSRDLSGLQSDAIRREVARYLENRSSLLEPPSYSSDHSAR